VELDTLGEAGQLVMVLSLGRQLRIGPLLQCVWLLMSVRVMVNEVSCDD
jgi:hypothetical protein